MISPRLPSFMDMTKLDRYLVILGAFAAFSLCWLATGTLIPYQAVRSGVYAVSAFFVIFAFSVVASYWIDIGAYSIKRGRSRVDLKRRIAIALFLVSLAALIVRTWEMQEDRELKEAKNAYKNNEYETATDLFRQQRSRYWTTDCYYRILNLAIAASEAGRKNEDLRIQLATISPNDKRHTEMKRLIDQLVTTQKEYPWPEGKKQEACARSD